MATLKELQKAEQAVDEAQQRLRDKAGLHHDDALNEVATALTRSGADLADIRAQLTNMAGKLAEFDCERQLGDLDLVLLELRRLVGLPDPGKLRIPGWVSRAASEFAEAGASPASADAGISAHTTLQERTARKPFTYNFGDFFSAAILIDPLRIPIFADEAAARAADLGPGDIFRTPEGRFGVVGVIPFDGRE